VHALCDRAVTVRAIHDALERAGGGVGEEDIRRVLDELCEQKLVHAFGSRYLRLALKGDVPPIPTAERFPGGYIEVRAGHRGPD
jgi:hypothetical protein